jgi:hypothetical protein
MDIIIENADIELNVSEYYRSRQDTRNRDINPADAFRLSRVDPSPSSRITELYPHY